MYNEELRIVDTLYDTEQYMKSLVEYKAIKDYQVVVVDDGSTDNSFFMVNKYKKKYRKNKVTLVSDVCNKGKGYAVRLGLQYAIGDYILLGDADMSLLPQEYFKLLNISSDYDLVVGSRWLDESVVEKKQPLLRRIYSRVFNFIIQLMFGLGIKDTQNGAKRISKRLSKILIAKSTIDRFSFDVEYFVICRDNGLMYVEIPVVWNDTKKQHFKIKTAYKMFQDLLKILKNLKDGVYECGEWEACQH